MPKSFEMLSELCTCIVDFDSISVYNGYVLLFLYAYQCSLLAFKCGLSWWVLKFGFGSDVLLGV